MVANWTRRAKSHVTYLSRVAIRPQVQTAGGNDARAQAGAQGKKQHVVDTHARTKTMFRDRACVGIVLHPHFADE